jgi:hypothetical protein
MLSLNKYSLLNFPDLARTCEVPNDCKILNPCKPGAAITLKNGLGFLFTAAIALNPIPFDLIYVFLTHDIVLLADSCE